ncbi:COBRA-like protein 10 [Cornus florida]|uniref:COBRA-like protein 10 n=1 Tax=Cornus florida TaxID=4283 RepID=UPI0028971337|nr:COBRA-like protein 10 [Cornus florida]
MTITIPSKGMKIPWKVVSTIAALLLVLFCFSIQTCNAQDYGDDSLSPPAPPAPPPEQENCNGIFLSYNFESREKEYPLVKNVSAQAWKFKSTATIVNAGADELKAWKMFIGFQHDEILVSATGVSVVDGDGFPAKVGNGTHLVGYPQTNLKTAIDTAGDFEQMSVKIEMTGTQFGVSPSATPLPKTIRLENEGFKCPAPKKNPSGMIVCCKKDPKFKPKNVTTKFMPRQYGDLSLTYDVTQAFEGNYMAQVTIDNNHPLGRLDHWNLTWEWMRGEFIYSMKGAYTHKKDSSECIYGAAGKYYKSMDFTPVMNCQKKPVISDLPPEKENDQKIGKIPFCCRNGSILPTTMNETKARSIFQLQVFKMPPDLNRTAFNPPMNWKIDGVLNPDYKCGAPIRVEPTEFPDTSGLAATSSAVATWQVTCNITKPKPKANRCCVTFSAYYSDAAVPCNTCACGCQETKHCNANGRALPLPPEALLVPFDNRTLLAKAYASLKHQQVPKKMPCPDNCGVSINWHIDTDFNTGWTARMTLFNWDAFPFEDWFTAIQMKKAFRGYENVYSFNGTKLPKLNNTIFFQGLKGLNYLVGITNGTNPINLRVPGKQQTTISFLKKNTPGINVAKGDGFPTRVIFNGEECALPTHLPTRNGGRRSPVNFVLTIFVMVVTFVLIMDSSSH